MSDPSFNDTVNSVKNSAYNSTSIERDWWNKAGTKARESVFRDLSFSDKASHLGIASEHAYQQDYKAKFNQLISTNYDSLPSSVKGLITEALIAEGELPNPSDFKGIGHEFVASELTGEVFIECDRCDETFMDEEDFEVHKEIDHGDYSLPVEDAVETYELTMNPDINREQLREARKLLAEGDQGDLFRNYIFNGKDIPQPTGWEPDDVKGIKGYNANPNAGLYDNKLFKHGTSQQRDEGLENYYVHGNKKLKANKEVYDYFNIGDQVSTCKLCGQELSGGYGYYDHLQTHYVHESYAMESVEEWWNSLSQNERADKIQGYSSKTGTLPHDTGMYMDSYEELSGSGKGFVSMVYSGESTATENGGYCNKCGTYQYASMTHHMKDRHPEVPRSEWKTLEYMGSDVSGDDRYVGDDIAHKFHDNREELTKAMGWGHKDDGWSTYEESHSDNESEPTKIEYEGDGKDPDYDSQPTLAGTSLVNIDSATDKPISSLEGVDFAPESIDYVYPTKATEAFEEDEDSFIDGYSDDDIESDKEAVEAQIIDRKLKGYSLESISRELVMKYGISNDEAYEKVASTEVSVNDKLANTFFNKKYAECTEAERTELGIYGGN